MGIKKLFDTNKPQAVLKSTSLEEEVVKNAPELESADNVREQIKRINRFIPQVDFSDPNNFVTYGSAQSYYEDALSRIYREFPYDGAEEEITKFHNESNYLDLYIFENRYPRTNGYIHFGTSLAAGTGYLVQNSGWGSYDTKEYIKIVGGPHTASGGMSSGFLHTSFAGANYYDTDIYTTDGTLPLGRVGTRESNLKFDLSKGVSVEFWLRKESFETSATILLQNSKEVIFDLWNGQSTASAVGPEESTAHAGYGRFLLYLTASGPHEAGADPLRLHLASGSSVADLNLLSSAYTKDSIADNSWHHYAVTVESGSTGITTTAYVDGNLDNTNTTALDFGEVTGSLNAHIGSLQTAPSGNVYGVKLADFELGGQARLSASIDEFRYWKGKRDEKDIQNNWWTQVRGGTNNEIANAELGVYYKFNEGITGTSSVDSAVLDYSGRISNGVWYAYPGQAARELGSAMVSSSAAVSGTVEYKDPIIYDFHPDVKTLYSELSTTGSVYDHENQASIKDYLPSWVVEQDETDGSENVKRLTQIIGSYFDTLNLQIKALPHLSNNTYLSSSHKPTPFARNLLSSKGLTVPEIFVDADILERFANRRDDRAYDLDINEVKNLIYQNIYNNLIYIYKSKGTEKAFRNLIRCYGIGDEVVQFNAYGNNTEFKFEDTDYSTTTRKNYADFNHPNRFDGIVYQSQSATNAETLMVTHISGTSKYLTNTAEVEVVFPRKYEFDNPKYFPTPFLSSSIFGYHESRGPSDFIWKTAGNDDNFQLYFVRTARNSRDGYFELKGRTGTFGLTSSVYSNVYDNQKWNFAVRARGEKWPYANKLSGSTASDQIILEWFGVNTEFGTIKNQFQLTASAQKDAFLTADRRYYIGADRTDFSSSVVTNTDVKISSLRHWVSYLENEVIIEHAKDPLNVGTKFPSRNIAFNPDPSGVAINNQTIPNIESLAMHWDFSQVTGSDASGFFTVEDASSGSVILESRYSNEGKISNIIANQYAGTGYFPLKVSSTTVISKEFIPTNRQRLPEIINSDDAVNVLTRDDELFPRDASPSQMFFAFEKSMYGVVSQEMINYFGTIVEFNNLIGDVVNKYRGDYKGLRLLRNLFFEKIQNNPDFDKFVDYYKWIDNSLGIFLQQLVPASADVSDEIRTVVEDHILGRSKYQHQYPHLDYKGNERWGSSEDKIEGRVKGIGELSYNWQYGHAPLPTAATATITVADGDAASGMDEKETIVITSTDGTEKTYCVCNDLDSGALATGDILASDTDIGSQVAGAGLVGAIAVALNLPPATPHSQNVFLVQLKAAIEHANGHNGKIIVSAVPAEADGAQLITLTQAVPGAAGNVTVTDDMSQTTLAGFTGGDDGKQNTSARWWKERASRSNTAFGAIGTATVIAEARQSISDIILSFNSASADKFNDGTGKEGIYEGSAYALRQQTRPFKMSVGFPTQIGGGYNYPRGSKPDAVFSIFKRGKTNARFDASKGDFKDIDVAETGPPIKQAKRKFKDLLLTENLDSNSYATNKFVPPVDIYSSSAGSTGYRSDTSGLEYAGYHNDSYGDDYDIPMQGPFTKQHVGGHRHRHTDITIDPTLTSSATRAEAWHLNNAIFRANDSTLERPSSSPQYRRDEISKRPLNIKNIQHRSGSNTISMGNFNKRYEVVQTSDRRTNNSEFVKSEGFSTASVTTDLLGYVGGLVDYAKPTRTRREHVIVERFSAPGGPEVAGDTIGGPGLDYESGQYSPYNNLNYRNITVRQPLRTLLTERSERFGLRSGSGGDISLDYVTNYTASYHKVHRNRLKMARTGSDGLIATASVYDNYYVQHMIPRSDLQYSWITASYTSTQGIIFGYLPYDGLTRVSSSLPASLPGGEMGYSYVSAINFTTASELGSVLTSAGWRKPAARTDSGLASNYPTNFVGMNTTILEPISSSDFILGYPLSADNRHYYNFSTTGSFTVATNTPGGFIERIPNTTTPNGRAKSAEAFNHLMSHRNGAYGYPTWKQIRVGQGQLARHYRKNNIYTHTPRSGPPIVALVSGGSIDVSSRNGETLYITQSAVDIANKPLIYKFVVKTGETRAGKELRSQAVVKASFGNNYGFFNNSNFNESIGVKTDFKDSTYREFLNIYGRKKKDASTDPIKRLISLKYKEVVYPSRRNIYKETIRGRTNYKNNFWRDDRSNRTTLGKEKKPTNSAGYVVTQSCWALDAMEDFETLDTFTVLSGGLTASNLEGHRSGELQNEYSHYHAGTSSNAYPAALYARKHILPLSSSVQARWGMDRTDILSAAHDRNLLKAASMFRGEAFWDAGTNAGRYEGTSSAFATNATNPFYDTYDEYFTDIKAVGQAYSIIPEFRITDHLDFYSEHSEDFLVENQKLFRIVGVPSGTILAQNSSDQNFFETFTNTDFLKYFEIIKKDHDGIVDPHTITLKCKAIKKLVPYDGFYPAERTIQLSRQFLVDYSASVSRIQGEDAADASSIRNFIKPLFSPGILYNTIKSGLAVDYPIVQSKLSKNTHGLDPKRAKRARVYDADPSTMVDGHVRMIINSASFAIFSSTKKGSREATRGVSDHFGGWDKRLPFEALIDPENYLANMEIGDDEPSPYARIESIVAWDGSGGTKYKKMINNFLAESINFFLKGKKLTTIQSLRQKEFKAVTPGTPYGMRVKMWRSQTKTKLVSGSWGAYEVPQNTRTIVEVGDSDPFSGRENEGAKAIEVTPNETFTMYSRPSAFGPPLGLIRSGNYDQWSGYDAKAGSIHDYDSANGVYASHTPPYYDGECWYDIIFWPRGVETQYYSSTPHIFQFKADETGEPYKPTLDEIFASPHESLFNTSASIGGETSQLPLAGSFRRKWRFDQEALSQHAGSSYHLTGGSGDNVGSNAGSGIGIIPDGGNQTVYVGPSAGPFINEWAMQLDASLNIFRKSKNTNVKDGQRKWSIQTKFETPMLNFNGIGTGSNSLTVCNNKNANACIPRGMWHQFGRIPKDGIGVYMQVTDIPEDWLANHPSASLKPDMAGLFSSNNKSPYVNNYSDASTYYNNYSAPIGTTASYQTPAVQSLVDVCGFKTDPVRIGELPSKRKMFEAVVAVPFKIIEGERKFFATFAVNDAASGIAGESYRRLVRMMRKYVFPPSLDFVNNTDVLPISMYVFEFSHTFDKDDISKIWQNVSPKIGVEAESSFSSVTHELLANELIGNLKEALLSHTERRKMPYVDMDKELRWMVFKVKQRAKRDYFTETINKEPEMPFYTQNWPYDFCSLVEMVQIEAGISFEKVPDSRKVGFKRLKDADAAAFGDRGEAGSGEGILKEILGQDVTTEQVLTTNLGSFGTQIEQTIGGPQGDIVEAGPGQIITAGGVVGGLSGVGQQGALGPGGEEAPAEGTIQAGQAGQAGGVGGPVGIGAGETLGED